MLTRLPGGLAVPGDVAARVLDERFAGEPLRLPDAQLRSVLSRLAQASVSGGAAYDGLVALEAGAHDSTLITVDRRAETTYRRLGVATRLVTG